MNLLKSIVNYRCPRCRSSKLFQEPFDFQNPLAMHDKCPVCDQHFTPEPGFYYGAMFISYGLGVFYMFLPALILTFGFDWPVERTMTFVLLLAAATFFRLMRLARSLWIHIVVRYDGRYHEKTS